MIRTVVWGGMLGLVLTAAGCGGDEGIGMDTHPVVGQVKFKDGTPVENARVTFTAVGASHASVGKEGTDATGKYVLITGGDDGAPAGEYTVTITGGGKSAGEGQPVVGAVPAKYGNASAGLKATVKPGDNTIPPFELDPK